MRRVASIDKHVRLFRLENGAVTELSRHAIIKPNDTIRTRSDVVSYSNLGWNLETLDGQEIVHNQRLYLSIDEGTSRERIDLFGDSSNILVASKSLEDRSRHRAQIRSERHRGVKANWKGMQFDCILGAHSEQRTQEVAGYEGVANALCVANRRQFYHGDPVVEDAPSPKDSIEIDGRAYTIDEITREIAVLTLRLTFDRGDAINK